MKTIVAKISLLGKALAALLLCTSLSAHPAPLPDWVRGSAACTLDLYPAASPFKVDVSLLPEDAAQVLGVATYQAALHGPALLKDLRQGLTLDGQAPTSVQARPSTDRELRFEALWPSPARPDWALKVSIFEDLGAPAWCRVFVFDPGVTDPSARYASSDQIIVPRPGLMQGLTLRFLKLGFTHILPKGVDHMLFVLALCLAVASLRGLLAQVTAFTLAHTLTLGLAAAGVLRVSPSFTEPLIAASIALVGLENLSRKEPDPWRWVLVFGFGLVHGLGFAGALSETGLPKGAFVQSLLCFNLGVEAGQLTVVAAFLTLFWRWRDRPWYRKAVVLPLSFIIAAAGLFWAVQRLWFPAV